MRMDLILRHAMLAIGCTMAAMPVAQAQTANQPLQIIQPPAPVLPKGEARVTVNYTISEKILGDADASAVLTTQSKSHRAIYEIASQECKMLLETIAAECRVETVNITATTQQRPVATGGIEPWLNTNGLSAFRIKTKD